MTWNRAPHRLHNVDLPNPEMGVQYRVAHCEHATSTFIVDAINTYLRGGEEAPKSR